MFSKAGQLALGPIKDLLLEMAEAREADALPSIVLGRVFELSAGLPLAAIWLVQRSGGGDELALAAVAAAEALSPAEEAAVRRVPIDAYDLGRLASTPDPTFVERASFDMPQPILNWTSAHDIVGFWGVRVAWQGQVLGGIGAFATSRPARADDDLLRLVASQLGAAIGRERAARELMHLRERLAIATDRNGAAESTRREGKAVLSEEDVRRLERDNIIAALEATRGRIYGRGGAAELLGLKPTTLASRLKKLGISARS
jgi:transcriptional regulator with GAF, ATPase, and Fis domain